jgi:glycosyltransferase involved in cell wall biosynthesis
MANDIVYITDSSGYGGAERYLIDIATAAKGRRMGVAVALPHRKENERLRGELILLGIQVINLRQYRVNYLFNFLIGLRFFLSRKDAFYHFTLPYPDACRWLLLAASLLRRRYIITELLVPPNPFKAGPYFFVAHLLFNPLKKFSYQRAEKVIAICNKMKTDLVKSYDLPSDKIAIIYNGVDPLPAVPEERKEQLRSQFDIAAASLVLTSIGRFTAQKGHTYLLAALERLVALYPSLVLLLVGDGELKGVIEAEIMARHLESNVRLPGFRDNVGEILSITDIFVFPSLEEGLPYMVLTSMAAGKPVIASRVGGIPEAVDEGVTGFMVPPKDVGELGEAMKRLIQDAALRMEMGRKGLERLKARFSKEAMLTSTLALYPRT